MVHENLINDFNDLEKIKKNLKDDFDSYKENHSIPNKEHQSLKDKNNQSVKDYAHLKTQYYKEENKRKDLDKKNKDLDKKNTDLEKDLNDFKNKYEKYREVHSVLDTTHEKLNRERNETNEKYKLLGQQYEDLGKKNNDLNNEYNSFKKSFSFNSNNISNINCNKIKNNYEICKSSLDVLSSLPGGENLDNKFKSMCAPFETRDTKCRLQKEISRLEKALDNKIMDEVMKKKGKYPYKDYLKDSIDMTDIELKTLKNKIQLAELNNNYKEKETHNQRYDQVKKSKLGYEERLKSETNKIN